MARQNLHLNKPRHCVNHESDQGSSLLRSGWSLRSLEIRRLSLLIRKENITPDVIPETAQRLSGIQYFQQPAGFRVRLSAAPE